VTSLRARVDDLQKRVRGLDVLENRVAELERKVEKLSKKPPAKPAAARKLRRSLPPRRPRNPARLGAVRALLASVVLVLALAVPAGAAAPSIAPHVVSKPIPFGAKRRAEMAAYAKRHYGLATSRLLHPRVLVEHFTATPSFSSVWNTFAGDHADPELHGAPRRPAPTS